MIQKRVTYPFFFLTAAEKGETAFMLLFCHLVADCLIETMSILFLFLAD